MLAVAYCFDLNPTSTRKDTRPKQDHLADRFSRMIAKPIAAYVSHIPIRSASHQLPGGVDSHPVCTASN